MARSGINIYNVIIKFDKKILADNTEETKSKVVSEFKLFNKTSYNELILSQEDTVCFQIVEEAKTKDNRYRDARKEWMKISRKFDPTTGNCKTIIQKKFYKYELYNAARNP